MQWPETDPDSEWQVADKQLSACILYRWVSSCKRWTCDNVHECLRMRLAVLHQVVLGGLGRLTDLGAKMRTCWVVVRVCVGVALGEAPAAAAVAAALAVPWRRRSSWQVAQSRDARGSTSSAVLLPAAA